MPNQVVILHGWSDTSDSFRPLARFLRSNGYTPVPIWLGDYISMQDDVAIDDVVQRMQQVVQERMDRGDLEKPFDMIVHSTGGLVARHWLSTYYPKGTGAPLKRLVMLAPANHGSPLAHLGQSMLGRVVKGFNNWFHTGTRMLKALELASPYQWDLAQRDLFAGEAEGPAAAAECPYGGNKVWPFVIVGTHPYTSLLRQIVNENGADGTVRVPGANLNVRGVTIDFTRDEADPGFRPWPLRYDPDTVFPFAVLPDHSHGSIVDPSTQEVDYRPPAGQGLGELILQALGCASATSFQRIAEQWQQISEDTATLVKEEARTARGMGGDKAEHFHQYLQVVIKVVDSYGDNVGDYFIEFFGPGRNKDEAAVFFHREVLEDVHTNSQSAALRCLFVDRTDLMERFYAILPPQQPKQLRMSLSATPLGSNVQYFSDLRRGAPAEIPVHAADDTVPGAKWLRRNTTHYVKIVIPRVASKDVFRLKRA